MTTKPHLPINPIKEEATQRAFKQVQQWLSQLFESIANQAAPVTYGIFTALVSGLVPAPGSALGKFLRDDATWQTITPGEVNTTSNVGAGAQLAKTKTGVDFPFRSLVGGTGVTVTQNTNDVTVDLTSLLGAIAIGIFGTGIDGDVVFDGSSTVLGITPSSIAAGIYRTGAVSQYVMTRDIYCNDLQIDSGVLLFPDSYRIFVKGTLTLNGFIGVPGVNGGTGSGVLQASRTATVLAGRLRSGGSATTPEASTTAPPGATNTNGGGGTNVGGVVANGQAGGVYKGGGGGSGTANGQAGGAGGTVTLAAASLGSLDNIIQIFNGRGVGGATTERFTASTGGGAGYPGTGGSGQGGGGAGPCVVIAREIIGSGSVVAMGGNGGNGGGGALPGSGGGGGGAGCFIGIIIATGNFPTTDVTGGAGGSGGGTTPGGNGGAGGDGFTKLFRFSL